MDPLDKLIAAHPRLFRGVEPRVPSHLPAGWYKLVDTLCTDIAIALGDGTSRFTFVQIKEKFGGLRAYYDLDGCSDDFIDIHDRQGGLETIVTRVGGSSEMTRLRELVSAAVEASERTCMRCGAPGELRCIRMYYSTLCGVHAAEVAKDTK
jgi:hypothetical protein